MKKENILYSVIGVLLGFIVGFAFANTMNQRGYAARTTPDAQQQMAGLPPDHPPVSGTGTLANEAAVGAAVKAADEQPDNFDAQVRAAQQLYAAQRYDEAVKLFARADKLRPNDFDVLVGLGNTNFDAEHFEEAERWYEAALRQQPDNVNVRTDLGLTFYFRQPRDVDRAVREFRASLERDPNHIQTLQNLTVALTAKGDAAAARATLSKLEASDPQNSTLSRLREDIEKLSAKSASAAKPSDAEGGGR